MRGVECVLSSQVYNTMQEALQVSAVSEKCNIKKVERLS